MIRRIIITDSLSGQSEHTDVTVRSQSSAEALAIQMLQAAGEKTGRRLYAEVASVWKSGTTKTEGKRYLGDVNR